jgi:hypothetical protein
LTIRIWTSDVEIRSQSLRQNLIQLLQPKRLTPKKFVKVPLTFSVSRKQQAETLKGISLSQIDSLSPDHF